MAKFRYFLLLILVLAVAFFTRWLLTSVEQPIGPGSGRFRHDPDYFLSNFTTIIYDKDGIPNYNIKAQHLKHFPDDDTQEITKLEVEYITATGERWLAFAEKGIIKDNKTILQLRQNVILKRKTSDPIRMLEVNTQELDINLVEKQAQTDAQVKILGKNSDINATGMIIDLESGTLTLKSKATGHYDPK